jgi:hypothetical protein
MGNPRFYLPSLPQEEPQALGLGLLPSSPAPQAEGCGFLSSSPAPQADGLGFSSPSFEPQDDPQPELARFTGFGFR